MQKISDSEWQVMKIIWSSTTPIKSSEIIHQLKPTSTWNAKTIHTLISRLVEKKVVGVSKESTCYHYYPLISESECALIETKNFLEKVYNGSLGLLMAKFLKEENFSSEEISELQDILNEKKGE